MTVEGDGVDLEPADGFEQPEPFDLAPGESETFDVELVPTGAGRYTLTSTVVGNVAVRWFNGAMENHIVTQTDKRRGQVGQRLGVQILLDPATRTEPQPEEIGAEPEPVFVDVVVRITNNSDGAMSDVTLKDLDIGEAEPFTEVEAVWASGAVGVNGVKLGTIAPGDHKDHAARLEVKDDGKIRFHAFAQAEQDDDSFVYGSGDATWTLAPKYLLGFTTTMVKPVAGQLIPAGEAIKVRGTVTNLSNSDRMRVGPVYPTLEGNAGPMSLTWDAQGTDAYSDVGAGMIELDPGESREFHLRVVSAYSDPIAAPHKAGDPEEEQPTRPQGGTSATLKFHPWARMLKLDGSEEDVEEAQIKASTDHLSRRVSIDDSVEIPYAEPSAYVGGWLYGGAQGVKNAAGAVLMSPLDGVTLCYTSLHALIEYQSQMWEEFTPEERDRFSQDVAGLAVEILKRNAVHAAMTPSELYNAAYEGIGQQMLDLENARRVGDWTQSVEVYSRATGDAVGQVLLPIAAAKMAKSALAVKALQRAQAARQALLETTIGPTLSKIEKIEDLGPLLRDIKSGTELTPDELGTLYGITSDELAELQKLASKYDFILTVRARHKSSIEWIKKGAMMKPEAIKVKSVSEMDVRLGYDPDMVGSVVFQKPTPLHRFEKAGPGANLEAEIDDFLQERGIGFGTAEAVKARERIALRIEEWKEYEKKYKQWSKLDKGGEGFIDVSYNYKGNAVDDSVRKGTGKYVGFRMKAQHAPGQPDSYVVQMFDAKAGSWAPITGDIDPIAFTHLDGSPLSMAEHADLLDDMRKNPQLRGQHPESATFVGKKEGEPHDGVAFVAKQFKVEADGRIEAGLQIAPGWHPPRVVRLNTQMSRWNSPFDYNLHWDGGFNYSGAYRPRAAKPVPGPRWDDIETVEYTPYESPPSKPLTQAQNVGEPTIGRCTVKFSNAEDAKPLVMTGTGSIGVVNHTPGATPPVTEHVDAALTTACLTEAPGVVEVLVKPTTSVQKSVQAGSRSIEAHSGNGFAAPGPAGLQVGQKVVIGAGTARAEIAKIAALDPLTFVEPLQYDHAAGESIVVVTAAELQPPTDEPVDSTTTTSTTTTTPPAPRVSTFDSTTAPRVSGQAVVGATVRATGASWTSIPTSIHYQWMVGSSAVRGATRATFRLTREHVRREVWVRVTASSGGNDAAATSNRISPRHDATVKLRLSRARAKVGERVTATVTVTSTELPRPVGRIVVVAGGTRTAVTLRASDRGRVIVRLAPARSGRHNVTATLVATPTRVQARAAKVLVVGAR